MKVMVHFHADALTKKGEFGGVSATEDPFISPDVTVPELTVRVLGVGIVLGVLMTAANAYLDCMRG